MTNENDRHPRKYVAAMYDDKWFIGNIVRKSEEYNDLYISFMQKK